MKQSIPNRRVEKYNHDLYNFYIVMYYALKGWSIQSKEKMSGRWEYDLRPSWNFGLLHYRVDPKQLQIRDEFIKGADVWCKMKSPGGKWISIKDPECVYYKDHFAKEWDRTLHQFDYKKNIDQENL